MTLHIEIVKKAFPVAVQPEATKFNLFEDGYLYKRKTKNQYCYLDDKGKLFLHFFDSRALTTEGLEKDYLESDIVFVSGELIVTSAIINAIV